MLAQGEAATVTLLIGTCDRIPSTTKRLQSGERNMRKIVTLAALALLLAAGTAAILVADSQQAMACKVRYCP
jgi:hypothetical protein